MTDSSQIDYGAPRKRYTATALVGLLAVAVICLVSYWPEFYGFASAQDGGPVNRLLSTPIHLSDDVMISLRSGYMLRDIGYPGFNRQDLAQASTSYAAPYLFALLSKITNANASVFLYAALGVLAVASTASIIFLESASALNGLLLVAALLLSRTSKAFALNGWDHLFQALFLVIAASLFLPGRLNRRKLLMISFSLALACLWRPDAIIFSIAILGSCCFESRKIKDWLPFGILPFGGVMASFLLYNIKTFGHLAPTTARLKIGASPSIQYSVSYLIKNGFLQFSAITIIALLACLYAGFLSKLGNRRSHILVASALATAFICSLNSDFLESGRMFWSSACVLAVVTGKLAPPLFLIHAREISSSLRQSVRLNHFYLPHTPIPAPSTKLLSLAFSGIILFATSYAVLGKAREAALTARNYQASETASQYVLIPWIKKNLHPQDGPLGFFCLGLSYHLPQFEIADFLGKADEMIAQSPMKWGPPGHNKWDISATIKKWNPQAIVPNTWADFSDRRLVQRANETLVNKKDYAFSAALITNNTVAEKYKYCYVNSYNDDIKDHWGLFIRKDIAAKVSDLVTCRESPSVQSQGSPG